MLRPVLLPAEKECRVGPRHPTGEAGRLSRGAPPQCPAPWPQPSAKTAPQSEGKTGDTSVCVEGTTRVGRSIPRIQHVRDPVIGPFLEGVRAGSCRIRRCTTEGTIASCSLRQAIGLHLLAQRPPGTANQRVAGPIGPLGLARTARRGSVAEPPDIIAGGAPDRGSGPLSAHV